MYYTIEETFKYCFTSYHTDNFSITMTRRLRLTLLIVALLIVLCSLLALCYAYWPLQDSHLQSTLAPTLLTPP